MESRLHFLTDDYKIAAVCDDYVSLSYTEDYCDTGEMELVLDERTPCVPAVDSLVLCGERLVYIVDKVKRERSRGTVTVHGKGILSYLGRCIVSGEGSVYSSPEALIMSLVRSEALFSVPGEIEYATVPEGEAVNNAIEEGDLLESVKNLAAIGGRGLSLVYDFDREKFIFSVTAYRDRRLGSSADPVLLSEGFDTIERVSDSYDLSRYANSVTVRGAEKADGTHYRVKVRSKECAFDDGYDDASAPSRAIFLRSGVGTGIYTTRESDGSVTFDEEAYLDALRTVGRKALAQRRPRREITAALSAQAAADVQVGDSCTLFAAESDPEEVRITKKLWSISPTSREYGAVLSAVR